MDASNTYPPYSGADIMRYLAGGMSGTEMRQLEMAAMDDPFLEDAIDGYREAYEKQGEKPLMASVEAVRAYELSERKDQVEVEDSRKAAVVPLWRRALQIAVAAMLVAGAGWYLLSLSNSEGNSQMAVTKTTAPEEKAAPALNDDTIRAAATPGDLPATAPSAQTIAKAKNASADSDDFTNKDIAQLESKQAKNPVPPANAPALPPAEPALEEIHPEREAKAVAQPSLTKAEALAENANRGLTHATNTQNEHLTQNMPPTLSKAKVFDERMDSLIIPRSVSRNVADLSQHKEDTKLQTIKGKVVDSEKYPLDNITLRFKGNPAITLSDELGRFEMVVPDSNATLIASAPGFKTKEFKRVQSDKKVELLMEREPSLEEIVVSGYAQKKAAGKKSPTPPVFNIDTTEASPEDGWEAYEKYVLANKRFKNHPGSLAIAVTLSFESLEDGTLTAFRVVQSGGNQYDNEAIRLVKEGPKWKNKDGEEIALVKITLVL